MTSDDPLMRARALVLRDLGAQEMVDAATVSLVEECLSERRWWLQQWAEGAAYIEGLVAQDVQDRLFDDATRWPLCSYCDSPVEHSLSLEPELGPDPRWVCSASGAQVAALGGLGARAGR